MKIFFSLILILFVAGCAGAADPYKAAGAKHAAKVADSALVDVEYYECVVASIGSITRKFGQSVEKWRLYVRKCGLPNAMLGIVEFDGTLGDFISD